MIKIKNYFINYFILAFTTLTILAIVFRSKTIVISFVIGMLLSVLQIGIILLKTHLAINNAKTSGAKSIPFLSISFIATMVIMFIIFMLITRKWGMSGLFACFGAIILQKPALYLLQYSNRKGGVK